MATSTSTTGPEPNDQPAKTSGEDSSTASVTNVEKTNEETPAAAASDSNASQTGKVEEKKDEPASTDGKAPAEPTPSSSTAKVDEDAKKEESTGQLASSNEKNDAFAIERGDSEHLTGFQRDKANYFFHVNLGSLRSVAASHAVIRLTSRHRKQGERHLGRRRILPAGQ